MDKPDPEPVTADTVSGVDQLDALAGQIGQPRIDIIDLIGNMVKALATFGHKTTNRSIRICRLNQLNRARGQSEKGGANSLLRDVKPVRFAKAEFDVGIDRYIQIRHDNPDVMQAASGKRRNVHQIVHVIYGLATGVPSPTLPASGSSSGPGTEALIGSPSWRRTMPRSRFPVDSR